MKLKQNSYHSLFNFDNPEIIDTGLYNLLFIKNIIFMLCMTDTSRVNLLIVSDQTLVKIL